MITFKACRAAAVAVAAMSSLWAVLPQGAASAQGVALSRQTLDLPRLFGDMRAYCLGQACAGMSISELATLPGARLVLDRPLIEEQLCNSRQQQTVNGTFTSADGTRLDVAFYLFPGPGGASDLYRAVVFNLDVSGVATAQFDASVGMLVARYRLSRPFSGPPLWTAERPMLSVSLTAGQFFEPAEVVSRLKLTVAPVGAFAFIANEPWCRGDPLPLLSAPPPGMPAL